MYLCESEMRVFILFAFSRAECQKPTLYPMKKKPSLPASGKTSRSRLYVYTHTRTDTHTRTNHTGSLSLSLSLTIIYIYIYYIILPHAKMNGLRLTVVECNMRMCR
jgi:hypothetical protein